MKFYFSIVFFVLSTIAYCQNQKSHENNILGNWAGSVEEDSLYITFKEDYSGTMMFLNKENIKEKTFTNLKYTLRNLSVNTYEIEFYNFDNDDIIILKLYFNLKILGNNKIEIFNIKGITKYDEVTQPEINDPKVVMTRIPKLN